MAGLLIRARTSPGRQGSSVTPSTRYSVSRCSHQAHPCCQPTGRGCGRPPRSLTGRLLARWRAVGSQASLASMTESPQHDPDPGDDRDSTAPPLAEAPDPAPGSVSSPGPGQAPGLRCRVRVGSADPLLSVVPHLLGFYPADSLVVLGIGGPHARIRIVFRYDLPD